MAQNITLLGASYSDCPAVLLPKTGGGTARFDDASVTTATASDVASGKIFLASNGTITTGTNSGGGGGASNVVTGTFKGTTTGAAMDVTLNYSGSGYPVAVVIYPTEGPYNSGTGSFYSLVQRYAICYYSCVKASMDTTPTYPSGSTSDANNQSVYLYRYKSSSSSATSVTSNGGNVHNYRDTDSAVSNYRYVMFRSKTKMSVFIAGTSYGFAANIEYTYWVIYSS